MAGAIRYRAEVDTSQAVRALGGLQSTILGIGSAIASAFAVRELTQVAGKFQDLRTTLGTLYQDSSRGAAVFEDIKRFAAESVFSVEDLTETVIKLRAAGIEPTISTLRLFADVSSVAADSVGALKAITDLYARTTAGGLGLEDLNRLADRGIPVFDILSKKLGLSRLEISKFGQSAEGAQIILKALEQGLQSAFGGASVNRLGTVNQAMSNLKDSIDNAFDTVGMSGFNQELAAAIGKLTEFISANQGAAKALGEGLGKVIQFVTNNIEILTKASLAFMAVLSVQALMKITQAFAIFNGVVGKNPIVRLLATLGTLVGTYAAVDYAVDEVTKEFEKLNTTTDKTTGKYRELKEGSIDATSNLREQMKGINEEANKQVMALQKIGQEYARNLDYAIQAVEREGLILETSRTRQRVIDEIARLEKDNKEALIQLDERYNSLDKKQREERRADYLKERDAIIKNGETAKKIISEQIQNIEIYRRTIEDSTKAYEFLGDAMEKMFREQIDLALETNANYEQQIEVTQRLNSLMEIRRVIMENIANIAAKDRSAATTLLNDIILSTKTLNLSYEDQVATIKRKIELAQQEGRISKESADELKKGIDQQLNAIMVAGKTMEEHNKRMAEQRRSWSYGWSKAYKDYVDDATNAAKAAESIFRKTTQGMEDMIVNFAKTGKFEFKSFINSILEDLLRSQIRQILAQTFSMMGNNGGGTSVLSNLFGGFFATGGSIPAGRYGVVGENGPEIVNGPAEVTPIAGTQVVYNINAVDARSFKQLLAEDPSYIYALTQQGSKSIPSRR